MWPTANGVQQIRQRSKQRDPSYCLFSGFLTGRFGEAFEKVIKVLAEFLSESPDLSLSFDQLSRLNHGSRCLLFEQSDELIERGSNSASPRL
jgi:hypothetical protein